MSTARRDSAWLSHLELLAGLPHPATALMPSVLKALRSGFDADFCSFGWVQDEHLRPAAFWSERITAPVLHWFLAHHDRLFAELPLRQLLASDGESARAIARHAGYEDHWQYRQLLAPLGVRWTMAAPVFNGDGRCEGFVYLYRRAQAGAFTDAEQARLRRARDALRGLRYRHPAAQTDGPMRPARAATVCLDARGRILARTPNAFEVLHLCHDATMRVLDWAADDWRALPPPARALVHSLIERPAAPHTVRCRLQGDAGRFEVRADRMHAVADGAPQVAVAITHLEPAGLAVARQLLHWPLSLQEKRLLVASVAQPSQRELAATLGIGVGTLKSYVNRLQARFEVGSRQALIDRLLAQADADADADTHADADAGPGDAVRA